MRFLKILFLVFLLLSFCNNAFASLSISQLKFEFDINAGTSKKEKIRITNAGNTPITLYSSKEDFMPGDDSGTPRFVKIGRPNKSGIFFE